MGEATSVSPWLLSKGFEYNTDLLSTPNSDGVSLLMAYALNLDPNQNQSSNIPKPVVTANLMSLSYYAGTAGITYTVETSTDLLSWDTNRVTTSAPDANNFCTATFPITAPRSFMRLKVTH